MRKTTMTLTPLALAAAMLMGSAHAGETIELGDGLKFDWRLNMTYTLAARVKDRAPALANQSWGNKNFDKGDLTANRLAGMLETKLHKGRTGLVVTASTFYDDVYSRSSINGNPLHSETKKYNGGYTRLLDTYAYTTVNFGEQSRATIRVGRQVVNWGESTFFANIAAAQGPFDASKSAVPGTEIKESVLPEDQVAVSLEMTPRWTLLGHWQFGFNETVLNGVGAYMSTSDVVGPGATCLSVPAPGMCVAPKGRADRPSDGSQWGIGTRYRVTDETEAGLYFLNYNNRNPSVTVAPDFSSYHIRYFDNIQMLAGTMSTTFGKLSGNTELSYRKGHPVSTPSNGNQRADILQWNMGGMYNIGRTDLADDMIFLAELAYARVLDVDNGISPSSLAAGRNSLALATSLSLSYPGITEGWDLSIPLSYQRQLKGASAGGVGTTMGGQGDHRLGIGATFTRQNNLSINVSYSDYLGSPDARAKYSRTMTDRDQVSLTVKYSF